MAKFCSKCGTPLAEGAVFCPECGARQEATPAAAAPVQQFAAAGAPAAPAKKKHPLLVVVILLVIIASIAAAIYIPIMLKDSGSSGSSSSGSSGSSSSNNVSDDRSYVEEEKSYYDFTFLGKDEHLAGTYTGGWKNGKPNGQGTLTSLVNPLIADGIYALKGEWIDGEFTGKNNSIQHIATNSSNIMLSRIITGEFKSGELISSTAHYYENYTDMDVYYEATYEYDMDLSSKAKSNQKVTYYDKDGNDIDEDSFYKVTVWTIKRD